MSASKRAWALTLVLALLISISPIYVRPAQAAISATGSVDVRTSFRERSDTFTFTVSNTSSADEVIRSLEITTPADYTVDTTSGCLVGSGAPASSTATRVSSLVCSYRIGAAGATGDMPSGSSASWFQVNATAGAGKLDSSAAWSIQVDADSDTVGGPGNGRKPASPSSPDALTTYVHVFEILDAVVATSSTPVNSTCPTSNRTAPAGEPRVITICGKSHGNVAVTSSGGSASTLSGTLIQSSGPFTGGSVDPSPSTSVVLGNWTSATTTATTGSGLTVITQIGNSGGNATAPVVTLGGYETVDLTAPSVTISEVSDALLDASETTTEVTWSAGEPGTYVVMTGGTDCADATAVTGTEVSGAYTSGSITSTVDADSLVDNAANTVRVCVTDQASNVGEATTTITRDSLPPTGAPGTPDLTASSDTGSSDTDDITSDTTPTFRGTGSDGEIVELLADGMVVGTATVDDDSYAITASILAEGTTLVTARYVDEVGNEGPGSDALAVTIDATAEPPILTGSTPSSPANDNDPTIDGTAETGSTVDLYTTTHCTGATAASGSVSDGAFSLSVSVPDDTSRTFRGTITDIAGNVSACSSSSVTFIEDSTGPPAPDAAPDLDGLDDSGSSDTDGITSHTSGLTFTGTYPTHGYTVELFEGTTGLGSATVTLGLWEIDGISLSEGVHSIHTKVYDLAGNPSPDSDTLTITIDATAPQTSIVSGPTGTVSTDSADLAFVSDESSTFTCQLEKDGSVLHAFSACDSGAISYGALTDGDFVFSVVATDVAGNVEPSVATREFTVLLTVAQPPPIDTAPPAVIEVQASTDTISPNGDGRLDEIVIAVDFSEHAAWTFEVVPSRDPVLTGAETFEVQEEAVFVTTGSGTSARVSWDGTSMDGSAVSEGAYTWTLTAKDASGNKAQPVGDTVRIDRTAPVVFGLRARPRPFNPDRHLMARIRFRVSEAATVRVSIRRKGRVRKAFAPIHVTGPDEVVRILWNGRNDRGRLVRPGRYIIRIKSVDVAKNPVINSALRLKVL